MLPDHNVRLKTEQSCLARSVISLIASSNTYRYDLRWSPGEELAPRGTTISKDITFEKESHENYLLDKEASKDT